MLRILFYFLNLYEYCFYGPRWKQVVTTLMGYPSKRVLTIIIIVIIVCFVNKFIHSFKQRKYSKNTLVLGTRCPPFKYLNGAGQIPYAGTYV